MSYIIILLVPLLCALAWFHRTRLAKKVPIPAHPRVALIGESFKWHECDPVHMRPFVGKRNFNPSMGVRNMAKERENLFLIENTYLEATNLRRQNLQGFEHKILHCHEGPRTHAAVREFYTMTMSFLMDRYPQYFKLDGEKNHIHNLINNDVFPSTGHNQDPMYLLKVLTCNIEEDILIMLKDNPADENEEYILRSSLTGSPAGFDPSHNFDQPISAIHGPVPQYKSRLMTTMHRFFNKLEPKDIWLRGNWSIQTNNVFFKLEDHHGRSGDEIKELTVDEIDFENACFMRCERQVLTRLPQSRANIMLVRTYLVPLPDIKKEGLGPEMAHAIESLPEDLAFYKRRQQWGKAVCEYLREGETTTFPPQPPISLKL